MVEIILEVSVDRILAFTPLPQPVGKDDNGGVFVLLDNVHMIAAKLFALVIYAFPAYIRAKIIHRLSTP